MHSSTRIAIAAGLVVGGLLSTLAPSVAASKARPKPAHPAAAKPRPVAVVSKTLGVFATGSAAGPGIIKGVAVTIISSQQLPAPLNKGQAAFATVINQLSNEISTNGPAGIAQLQAALAPLACANPAVDAGLAAFADALDAGAIKFGSLIQPFDLSAHQTATLVRSFEAPAVKC